MEKEWKMPSDLREETIRPELVRQAEALLQDWYEWTRQWRPQLGIRTSSPYGYGIQENADCDDDDDGILCRARMETVECCVNSLPPEMARAIGLEMRRRSGSCAGNTPQAAQAYRHAVKAIVPKMAGRCLLPQGAAHPVAGRAWRRVRQAKPHAGVRECRKAAGG